MVEVGELLQERGYDATTVLDQHLGGGADSDIARVRQREGRALVTVDTDFADLWGYPPGEYSGLIVPYLRRQDKPYVSGVIGRLINVFSVESLKGHL